MVSDRICIRGLRLRANHGVYAWENRKGQTFIVNAVLFTDTRKAGRSDELSDSTNYGSVCQLLTEYLQTNTFKLIEAAAEGAAHALLLAFPLVQEVELELCKPEAPIGLPFENVSVCIKRGWHRVYLGLGSSIGDRHRFISDAIAELEKNPDMRKLRRSTLIDTEPYGGAAKETFLNGVLELETLLTPQELLDELHRLEQMAHRERLVHWGDRTLDLDILLYDDCVISTDTLLIPHIDMQNRSFVLEPMAELAPNLRHPLLNRTMRQLLDDLRSREG